ncbi:hypothetical protein F5878DRAFT_690863 [Lentinula raphanica]|uniref:Uncharacterized protein n=1 Tax=Lentinula raphanica TaxID=153919 RepID=A0AA38P4N8_9AGAR|nr:hypothetical protein F5878DRAFT_690863 [Lentinula raphanica]
MRLASAFFVASSTLALVASVVHAAPIETRSPNSLRARVSFPSRSNFHLAKGPSAEPMIAKGEVETTEAQITFAKNIVEKDVLGTLGDFKRVFDPSYPYENLGNGYIFLCVTIPVEEMEDMHYLYTVYENTRGVVQLDETGELSGKQSDLVAGPYRRPPVGAMPFKDLLPESHNTNTSPTLQHNRT